MPGPPLRLAVLGDFEGPHTRRWLRLFVERGHDLHAISYYPPRADLPGVRLHVLSDSERSPAAAVGVPAPWSAARRLPPALARFVHAWRYRRAGLPALLTDIAPDVFHAHYAVEHGFYGALAGFHPYVVSAWGSDLLVESRKPLGRLAARYALGHADLVTAQDGSLARRAIALGVAPERIRVVRLGIDALFLAEAPQSVNVAAADAPPTLISDRALEPSYNVDVILRAFAGLRRDLPAARLLVAHEGSQRPRLEALAHELGLHDSVRFLGRLDPPDLRRALAAAHVYVSLPDSDAFALSTMEAMAVGCFPVISDLPSADGMITHAVNGLRVAPGDVTGLTNALLEALNHPDLRRNAAATNHALIEAEGRLEPNMLVMERLYYRLAGHHVAGEEST